MTVKQQRMIELEVCVQHAEDGIAAVQAGATRIELNTALHLDGLTATSDACREFKRACQAPLLAMVRPHHRSFCYSADELREAVHSCGELIEAGADGIVFGGLDAEGRIDVGALHEIAAACQGRPLVFHRAFDELVDQPRGLEQLIEHGVCRVLTSGGARSALEGASQLRKLVEQAAGRIEILPGGGLSAENALQILAASGCGQLHGSFRGTNPSADRPDLQAIRQTRAALDVCPP